MNDLVTYTSSSKLKDQFQKVLLEKKIEKQKEPSHKHVHEWQTFKESVRITNHEYRGGAVYLIVRACLPCQTKVYVDIKR